MFLRVPVIPLSGGTVALLVFIIVTLHRIARFYSVTVSVTSSSSSTGEVVELHLMTSSFLTNTVLYLTVTLLVLDCAKQRGRKAGNSARGPEELVAMSTDHREGPNNNSAPIVLAMKQHGTVL